jgi:precorrin-2 methylase
LSPFHYYIKHYYASRIKEEHYHRYAVAEKLYDEATEEERIAKNMEVPVRVSMMTSICTEFWKLEAADFRDEVAKQAEAAFLKELEEWEALQKAPKTPQQFHQ